jgi:hypothetical protein
MPGALENASFGSRLRRYAKRDGTHVSGHHKSKAERDDDGVAGVALKSLNLDIEQTRREILKELDPNFSRGYDG